MLVLEPYLVDGKNWCRSVDAIWPDVQKATVDLMEVAKGVYAAMKVRFDKDARFLQIATDVLTMDAFRSDMTTRRWEARVRYQKYFDSKRIKLGEKGEPDTVSDEGGAGYVTAPLSVGLSELFAELSDYLTQCEWDPLDLSMWHSALTERYGERLEAVPLKDVIATLRIDASDVEFNRRLEEEAHRNFDPVIECENFYYDREYVFYMFYIHYFEVHNDEDAFERCERRYGCKHNPIASALSTMKEPVYGRAVIGKFRRECTEAEVIGPDAIMKIIDERTFHTSTLWTSDSYQTVRVDNNWHVLNRQLPCLFDLSKWCITHVHHHNCLLLIFALRGHNDPFELASNKAAEMHDIQRDKAQEAARQEKPHEAAYLSICNKVNSDMLRVKPPKDGMRVVLMRCEYPSRALVPIDRDSFQYLLHSQMKNIDRLKAVAKERQAFHYKFNPWFCLEAAPSSSGASEASNAAPKAAPKAAETAAETAAEKAAPKATPESASETATQKETPKAAETATPKAASETATPESA